MKKLFVSLVVSSFMMSATALADDEKVFFTVNPPMSCSNCENKIKNNLRFEKGIKSVKPSAKDGMVEVVFDTEKTNVEKIEEGFKKIGYSANPMEQNVTNKNNPE